MQEPSGGLIRLPSRMIHIDKISPIKKVGPSGFARVSSKSNIDLNSLVQKSPLPAQPSTQSSAVSYPLSHPPLKDMTLKEQITSNTFMQLTAFFVISSFWANFIIGMDYFYFTSALENLIDPFCKFILSFYSICLTLFLLKLCSVHTCMYVSNTALHFDIL